MYVSGVSPTTILISRLYIQCVSFDLPNFSFRSPAVNTTEVAISHFTSVAFIFRLTLKIKKNPGGHQRNTRTLLIYDYVRYRFIIPQIQGAQIQLTIGEVAYSDRRSSKIGHFLKMFLRLLTFCFISRPESIDAVAVVA